MPYHDSNYPSVLREKTPKQSMLLMRAAPKMLDALKKMALEFDDWTYGPEKMAAVREAIEVIREVEPEWPS